MTINVNQINDILKTLPIGYYTGREVKTELDATMLTSCYDPINDKIYVSIHNIIDAFANLNKDLNNDELEEIIRGLLYHEVSHAILTPKNLLEYEYICDKNWMNIFEDHRIETLLKNYYMGVDFKKNLKILNPDDPMSPQTFLGALFDFIRFDKAPQEFIDARDELVLRRQNLNRDSNSECYNYSWNIKNLCEAYKEWWEQNQKDDPDQQSSDNQDGNNDNSNGSNDSDNSGDSNPNNQNGNNGNSNQKVTPNKALSNHNIPKMGDYEKQSLEEQMDKDFGNFDNSSSNDSNSQKSKDMSKGGSMGKKGLGKTFTQLSTEYVNDELITELSRIFGQSAKIKKMNSSAINTYSGVFDPRSVVRNDYKYFLQKNRSGSARAYSNVHLNLFLDCSGSFGRNEHIANEILYALCSVEKKYPDFTFTLISCGNGEKIKEKKNMYHECTGGTYLSTQIFDTFKKVQKTNAINYNIVLYDGEATYDGYSAGHRGYHGNFAAFNTNNTLIITDPENQYAVETYCPSARKIISENYTDELISNLLKMLEILTR